MAKLLRIWLSRTAVLSALVFIASCAPTHAPSLDLRTAGDAVSGPRTYSSFKQRIAQSESIAIARLVDAAPSAADDRFALTSTWAVVEQLKGTALPARFTVRFPSDVRSWREGPLNADATPLFRGRTYVLFVSRDVYERQVAARRGTPLPGVLSAGIGYFLINGSQVVAASDYGGPPDLNSLRRLIGEAQ